MSTTAIDPKTAFVQAFRDNGATDNILVNAHREVAREALEGLSVPNRKWEDWKYTNLRLLESKVFQPAKDSSLDSIEDFLIPGLDADILVYVNGFFQESLSRINQEDLNFHLSPISKLQGMEKEVFEAYFGQMAEGENNIFTALNTAFCLEGTLVYVPKRRIVERPVHIIHIAIPENQEIAFQHRNLFVIEEGASAKLIETYHTIGEGSSLRNDVTEILVRNNAQLEHIKIQTPGNTANQINLTEVHQHRDSNVAQFTITTSGELIRNELFFRLKDENTSSKLMGAYLLSGKQQLDNFTQVNHMKPNCFSEEMYKGILDEQSTGAFTGRINVYQDAQKTNAYQSNRNILLSDTANIFTKPQLEIYADDVKCSHGATTGRLDQEAMFYLQARGISAEEARKLLIHAFVLEATEQISIEPVREYIDALVSARY